MEQIRTERLLLRPWREEDFAPFAELNADARVMEHFPRVLTREESDAFLEYIRAHWKEHGFGLWALELPGEVPFIGFVGLAVPRFTAHFTPCVEVGWRLSFSHWRRGYATEGARAAVRVGFSVLGLDEIVAFTVPGNKASRRVMEKLGMTHSPEEDFDYPSLPEGHPLRRHVLYRLKREVWEGRQADSQAGEGRARL